MKIKHGNPTTRIVTNVNGFHTCYICKKTFTERTKLSDHLFFEHTEDQVLMKYTRTIYSVLNSKVTARLRKKVLRSIQRNKWHEMIEMLVGGGHLIKTYHFDPKRMI